jgi:hypothetical protein
VSYEDRELRARVRAMIDARPVPDRTLRPARARTPTGLLLSVGVLVAVVVLVIGTQLRTRTPVTGPDMPASVVPTASAASAPANPVAALRLELPADFPARGAMVSPDGRFVGGVARDQSRAVLWRVDRKNPPTDLAQLVQVAELRGRIGQLSWLEDSSALLVERSAPPTDGGGVLVPPPGVRVVMVETDGRLVPTPTEPFSFAARRANLSPDAQWIPVYLGCCGWPVRVLSRDGLQVRTVVPSPLDGSTAGFVGWDKAGLLLYQQTWTDHSMLYAVDLKGAVRYSVPTPREFGGAGWGPFVTSPDRSWRLIQFYRGIGDFNVGHRLLVDGQLRALPAPLETGLYYAASATNDELIYRGPDGQMLAYNVRTSAKRILPLVVPSTPQGGLSTVGALDRFYVWMELIHGFVGNLDTGNSVDLPLQSPLYVDRLDGPNLAEYRDNSIAIFDLAAWMRTYR